MAFSYTKRADIALLILAGVGAGTLIGALTAVVIGRRAWRSTQTAMSESVEELKEKTQQILGDLTASVAELVGKSRELLQEQPSSPGTPEKKEEGE